MDTQTSAYMLVDHELVRSRVDLNLWDPMDYSPLGSSVHEILRARILELAAIPFSRGSY